MVVPFTMTSVAIPPYSSGQFGPSPPRLDVPFLGNESQSLRTAQGNSDSGGWQSPRTLFWQIVAIPPYSSGQFGPRRGRASDTPEKTRESQSLRTAQGNSDMDLPDMKDQDGKKKSQSLRTAQGNSDRGLPRLLIPGHLAGRFG